MEEAVVILIDLPLMVAVSMVAEGAKITESMFLNQSVLDLFQFLLGSLFLLTYQERQLLLELELIRLDQHWPNLHNNSEGIFLLINLPLITSNLLATDIK